MKCKRLFTFVMAIIMMFSLCTTLPVKISVPLQASATQIRKDNFNKNYTLTGDGPTDMLNIAFAQIGKTGSDLGYSESWCANFVSDCADLAGQSQAIPRHGAVSNLRDLVMSAGGSYVTSPIPGDLVIWKNSISHVEIVSKVENGVVYSIGGNNGGTGNPSTNRVAGERKVTSIGTVTCYVRPNYSGNPKPELVTPIISTDKGYYTVGDTVNISWAASPSNSNLSHYWLTIIAPDGTYVYGDGMGKSTSYSFVASQAGGYSITTYATPIGSLEGEGSLTDTKTVNVTNPIPAPTYSNLTANKTMISVGEEITFTASSDYATGFTIGIDNETSRYVTQEMPNGQLTLTFDKAGTYTAYVTSYNSVGYLDSTILKFFVSTPYDFGDEKFVYISQTCSNLFMTADTGEFSGAHNVYGTEKNFQVSQIWKLKKQMDGSYKLLNMSNKQCMEVFNGAAANGTNISTYDETASFENQKFNFYYINGHYFISPICTPCLVDMNPDGSHDVATYDYGDEWSSHQIFDITEVPKFISDNINRDFSVCDLGDEKLVYISQTCSNLFMTADTGEFTGAHNVYGTEKNFQASQIWKLKKQMDGSYKLLNMGNKQCMEVFNGAAANGTNISTYDETASFENQKFNFYYINGHYFISPICTPCLVDMNPDGSHDVATYDYGDDWSSHQIFDITEVPEFISGDINCDLSVSVADAVLLEKWLLGMPDTKLGNWRAADLCEDGRLDAFDMIEMRKLIINSQSAQ